MQPARPCKEVQVQPYLDVCDYVCLCSPLIFGRCLCCTIAVPTESLFHFTHIHIIEVIALAVVRVCSVTRPGQSPCHLKSLVVSVLFGRITLEESKDDILAFVVHP